MTKKNRVCIYYKEHITLIKRDDIYALDNCLVKSLKNFSVEGKCFLTSIYHFPSQTHDEFYDLRTKFDLLLSNVNHVQLPPEILMPVAQYGRRMILLTQQVKKSILPHRQLDISK